VETHRLITSRKLIFPLFLLLFNKIIYAEQNVLSGQEGAGLPNTLIPQSQESATLNVKLREAMALYYNGSYRLALPIFQEIAAKNASREVLYWLGRSAYETGQTQLAIEKYQQILAREPNLARVRLELAAAYKQADNNEAAQKELQTVLAENPDAEVKQLIEKAVVDIEEPQAESKRFFAAIRASMGTEYDSNINVGPRDERILLANNQALTSNNIDGWLLKFDINGDVLYDFGDPNGFVWHNHLQFLHHEYPDPTNNNFNYTQTDVYTGLDYYDSKFKAKLPFGFIDRRFSNEDLSHSYYFMPNLEINVLENIDFSLSYRYEDEDFIAPQYDTLSGVTHTGSFGPRYKFEAFDAEHSLALFGTYSRRDANTALFSYDEWSVGPSYFARFKTGTELYLDFKYLNRDYDAPVRLPALSDDKGNRLDDRYTLTFSLSQTFYKNYFVSLGYTYTDNASNAKLFDYDKNMVGLNIGTNLGF
jgi:tetratricopeptide (TPR) repeat protein